MSKAHYFQYLKDIEGNPIVGASINVFYVTPPYDTPTYAPAYIFESETDVIADNTTTLSTSADGFFEFWIGDRKETNGYSAGSKFKITWEKEGYITAGSVDFIDVWIDKNKASVHRETIEAILWVNDEVGYRHIDITHNLDEPYPMVVCYDDASHSVVPITAKYINDNITRVIIAEELALKCYIMVIG